MADQVKLRKRLEALLKLPDNQICADCNKRGPRWASANLGIFFCIECSGIHRNLGVHISFVRSVNLDSWTEKQVQFMEEWGNGRANAYYEANLPSHVLKPKEGDSVRTIEKYIRDKYEHKRYIGSSVPDRTGSTTASASSNSPAVTPSNGFGKTAAAAAPANRSRNFVYEDEQPAANPVPVARKEVVPAPQVVQQVRAAPAPIPVVAAAPAPAVDLLNFMDEPAAPAPAPAQVFAPTGANTVFGFESTPAVAAVPAATQFGSFGAFEATPAPHQGQNAFGDSFGFDGAFTAPAAAPTAPPAKPQASADSILSLFAPAPPVQQQQGYGQSMMAQHQHQGWGMNMQMNQGYPAQPHQPQHHQPQQHQQQGFYSQQQHQQPAYGAPYGQQPAAGFPGNHGFPQANNGFPPAAHNGFPPAANNGFPPSGNGFPVQQNAYATPQQQPSQQQPFANLNPAQNGWR